MKVVIAEPIPSLNKGEAAILRGIQEALAICGDIKLTLYSPSGWVETDKKRYGSGIAITSGVDLWDAENNFLENPVSRNRTHFFKTWGKLLIFSLMARVSKRFAANLIKDDFLSSLAHADLIIAGHDGMIGHSHFWIVLAAKIMNKPIALYGGGNDVIGRSKRLRVRKFLQFMANNSILFTIRDENTRDYLIANDVNPNKVHLFPDPAVLLKPCSKERVDEILKIENIPVTGKPLFALIPVRGGIVSDKSFSSEQNPDKKHELRVKLWVDLLLHLLNTTDAHFVFLPHCIGPTFVFDDRRMMKDIYDAMIEGKDRITVINNEYSEGDLKGLMKRCDFILGERTHALIGAVSAAAPCMALTVEEDLRMHYIINKMFKRPTFNLNYPDVTELKKLLTTEWNNRKKTALEMAVQAEHIHKEALKAANMLKERIEVVYGGKKED